MTASLSRLLETALEWILIVLMVALTVVVIVAVGYRKFGASLSWYDEVASIGLAWVTYYGAALAALKRRHIGFDGVLLALPVTWRFAGVVVAEVLVIGFFALLAWAGFEVLAVLEGVSLVSLTWMPVQPVQSVIPIGALLFILAELLSLPRYMRSVLLGISAEHVEADPPDRPAGGA